MLSRAVALRVRFHIIRNACILSYSCKYESCTVSNLRVIWTQTVPPPPVPTALSAQQQGEDVMSEPSSVGGVWDHIAEQAALLAPPLHVTPPFAPSSTSAATDEASVGIDDGSQPSVTSSTDTHSESMVMVTQAILRQGRPRRLRATAIDQVLFMVLCIVDAFLLDYSTINSVCVVYL